MLEKFSQVVSLLKTVVYTTCWRLWKFWVWDFLLVCVGYEFACLCFFGLYTDSRVSHKVHISIGIQTLGFLCIIIFTWVLAGRILFFLWFVQFAPMHKLKYCRENVDQTVSCAFLTWCFFLSLGIYRNTGYVRNVLHAICPGNVFEQVWFFSPIIVSVSMKGAFDLYYRFVYCSKTASASPCGCCTENYVLCLFFVFL